jgi:xylan 1,4-beta-xylosidase
MILLISMEMINSLPCSGQAQKTFCNPVNLDYGFTPIPDFSQAGRHRATADPVIVLYKNNYFLFSTNQWGYWFSPDMVKWTFISRLFLKPWHKVYDELCAPAVWTSGDTMFVVGSTWTKTFPIWMSTNPFIDDWKEAIDSSSAGAWDPAYFRDDDGKLYLYYGSSNLYPLYGYEIDRATLQPMSRKVVLFGLNDEENGWERFGEYNDNNFLSPFIEGAWMTKHNGKYFLQYGAPGTEIRGYADGVYTSDQPLGPWTYQAHNPFCYKPEGFTRGSGHGSTYQDVYGNWWHITTNTIAVKNNFERRLSIFPAGFDDDNILYCNTAFGDYPVYLPEGTADHRKGSFTGWMLLNYEKPVQVSSTLGSNYSNFAVDEDIRTYWCARSDKAGEWIQSDLGALSTVNAIQINYADQDVPYLGKRTDIYHQYKLWQSADGKKWQILIDKSRNKTDVPHDYIELAFPVKTRFIKLENIHMAAGKFAISGLRIFGNGNGHPPDSVKGFVVLRQQSDKRNAYLKWYPDPNAYTYNIYYGISPDKLYTSIMIYTRNEYYLKSLNKNTTYYFRIEAINESGTGPGSQVLKTE